MTPFGTLPDGREIHAVSIGNDQIAASFLTLGARLYDARFEDSGSLVPHIPLDELTTKGKYTGVIVGPVMNRLGHARAPLDDRVLEFTPNEGANLLHSGADGIHAKVWEVAEATKTSVTFRLDLPPDSFPGNRRFEARYRLDAADLVLEIAVTTDAPTLMNVGFHPYWTMSGKGPSVDRLSIEAPGYLPMGEGKIPTGEIADVSGTAFDFRKIRAPARNVDHCFVLTERSGVEPAVRLSGGGITMDVLTDAPAVHIYTGKDIGTAIEPEIHPDAPNHTGFPSIRLGPGETFRQTVIHRFSRV